MVGIIFGSLGGPVGSTGPSWGTVAVGLALWGIASLWTAIAIRGSGSGQCDKPDSPVCDTINSVTDASNSVNEIHKVR
jgi:hypothetical protein